VLVNHACHPSYSGGRDQENQVSKPAPGKQFARPYLKKKKKKKKSQKSAGGTRPSVQTPVLPKRKKEKKEEVFQQLY
jgi:hypothetical protein